MATEKPKYHWPLSAGGKVDHLHHLQLAIKLLQAQVKLVEDEYDALEDALIKGLPKQELNGAQGKLARVEIDNRIYPIVTEEAGGWEATYKHIKKTGEFDLLQKRLHQGACEARWDAGKQIPGVGTFTRVKLKLTPIKERT
jgi:hypothetical protein